MKINHENKEVTIPEEDFNMMLYCMLELNALKKYGVNEWRHYNEAIESIKQNAEGDFGND